MHFSRRSLSGTEGYVVRLADVFPYGDFRTAVAKFVRPGHDRTRSHWFHDQPLVVNGMREA